MRISVAMCTYNGEAYVEEQLKSISNQTRLPDELIVCDDQSTDYTRELLKAFASQATFKIELQFNRENLGVIRNFEQAIRLCSSDIIVLCDQDDIWHKDKLIHIESIFESEPQVGLVFSNAEVVDERLNPTGFKLWDYTFLPKEQRLFKEGKAFNLLSRYNVITGATMAFRASFKELILPIPTNLMAIHDGWIALLIAAVSDVRDIPDALIKYRQHKEQGKGLDKGRREQSFINNDIVSNLNQKTNSYLSIIAQSKAAYDRLAAHSSRFKVEKRLKYLKAQMQHYQLRANMPSNRAARIPILLKELVSGRYHQHSRGFASFAKDLLI
jgi:glycosyltransferase involved in cell wall biosynthesis